MLPRPAALLLLLTQLTAFAPKAQRRQTVKIKSESDGRLLAVKAREAELRAQLQQPLLQLAVPRLDRHAGRAHLAHRAVP